MPIIAVEPCSSRELDKIAASLAKAQKIVVMTGAGISTNCGIPDFRSDGGMYALLQNANDILALRPQQDVPDSLFIDGIHASNRPIQNSGNSLSAASDIPSRVTRSQKHNPPPKPTHEADASSDISMVDEAPSPSTVSITSEESISPCISSKSASNKKFRHMTGQDWFRGNMVFQSRETASEFMKLASSMKTMAEKVPNTSAAHKFIRLLRDNGRLVRNYTQNIDMLEAREGLCNDKQRGTGNRSRFSRGTLKEPRTGKDHAGGAHDSGCEVVSLHGTLNSLRCNNSTCQRLTPWDKEALDLTLAGELLPCPHCTNKNEARGAQGRRQLGVGYLRPDIVLYGEESDEQFISKMASHDIALGPEILIVMGTSLKVTGFNRLVKEFSRAVHSRNGMVIYVNNTEPAASLWGDLIDYWVGFDCDQWIKDLRVRSGDIWDAPHEAKEGDCGSFSAAMMHLKLGDSGKASHRIETLDRHMPETPDQQLHRENELARQNKLQFIPHTRFSRGRVSDSLGPESMHDLRRHMESNLLPYEANPQIGDRNVYVLDIHKAVEDTGGYQKVQLKDLWSRVAKKLGFNLPFDAQEPLKIKQHYEQYLLPYLQVPRPEFREHSKKALPQSANPSSKIAKPVPESAPRPNIQNHNLISKDVQEPVPVAAPIALPQRPATPRKDQQSFAYISDRVYQGTLFLAADPQTQQRMLNSKHEFPIVSKITPKAQGSLQGGSSPSPALHLQPRSDNLPTPGPRPTKILNAARPIEEQRFERRYKKIKSVTAKKLNSRPAELHRQAPASVPGAQHTGAPIFESMPPTSFMDGLSNESLKLLEAALECHCPDITLYDNEKVELITGLALGIMHFRHLGLPPDRIDNGFLMTMRAAAHYADIILEGNEMPVLDLIRAEYNPNGERQYRVIHLPLSELESSKTQEFAKAIRAAASNELSDRHVQLTALSLSAHTDRWLLKHVPLFMKSIHCALDFEIRARSRVLGMPQPPAPGGSYPLAPYEVFLLENPQPDLRFPTAIHRVGRIVDEGQMDEELLLPARRSTTIIPPPPRSVFDQRGELRRVTMEPPSPTISDGLAAVESPSKASNSTADDLSTQILKASVMTDMLKQFNVSTVARTPARSTTAGQLMGHSRNQPAQAPSMAPAPAASSIIQQQFQQGRSQMVPRSSPPAFGQRSTHNNSGQMSQQQAPAQIQHISSAAMDPVVTQMMHRQMLRNFGMGMGQGMVNLTNITPIDPSILFGGPFAPSSGMGIPRAPSLSSDSGMGPPTRQNSQPPTPGSQRIKTMSGMGHILNPSSSPTRQFQEQGSSDFTPVSRKDHGDQWRCVCGSDQMDHVHVRLDCGAQGPGYGGDGYGGQSIRPTQPGQGYNRGYGGQGVGPSSQGQIYQQQHLGAQSTGAYNQGQQYQQPRVGGQVMASTFQGQGQPYQQQGFAGQRFGNQFGQQMGPPNSGMGMQGPGPGWQQQMHPPNNGMGMQAPGPGWQQQQQQQGGMQLGIGIQGQGQAQGQAMRPALTRTQRLAARSISSAGSTSTTASTKRKRSDGAGAERGGAKKKRGDGGGGGAN